MKNCTHDLENRFCCCCFKCFIVVIKCFMNPRAHRRHFYYTSANYLEIFSFFIFIENSFIINSSTQYRQQLIFYYFLTIFIIGATFLFCFK